VRGKGAAGLDDPAAGRGRIGESKAYRRGNRDADRYGRKLRTIGREIGWQYSYCRRPFQTLAERKEDLVHAVRRKGRLGLLLWSPDGTWQLLNSICTRPHAEHLRSP
jgi:hypothetical protein